MGQPTNRNYPDSDGAARGIRSHPVLDPVKHLVGLLRRQPGITEISLAFRFTPSDFGLRVYSQTWSYRIKDTLLEAERKGLIRHVKCLDPLFRSYFVVETQVTT